MKEIIDYLLKANNKPSLFEKGFTIKLNGGSVECIPAPKFWDDEYISKSMLNAHFDQSHDLASRNIGTVNKTVEHMLRYKVIKPGMKLLDLGCGPGLYAEKLCKEGVDVIGLDISKRSIEYARNNAIKSGLNIEYRCMDFLQMDFIEEFDAVIQVYGELSTFSNQIRDRLFMLVNKALKKEGVFIFDLSTRALRLKYGLKNGWYMSEGGFWREGKHMVLEQGFDYPEEDVWLDQFVVIDEQKACVYRNWYHDYSLDSFKPVLESTGFTTKHVWNDLTGSDYNEGGEWVAIAAQKKGEGI